MDIERLSRFGSAVRDRVTAAWAAVQTRHWPRVKETSLDTWKRSAQAREWISKHPNLAIAPAVIVAIFVLLIAREVAVAATLIGAWFALARGISQGAADFRRRINETYSKAVSQLASDKLEERLGGIYTLENISKESPDDYWTVMETLTAFVRERSQRNYAEFKKSDERIAQVAHALWEEQGKSEGKHDENWARAIQLGEPPATDIAAVLTVINRRGEQSRERERANDWHLDLGQAVLKSASLWHAHLEGADLWCAHLEGAHLGHTHLEGAYLRRAHLEGASFWRTHLEGAKLQDAHLEGADLRYALDLSEDQLHYAHGDAATRLPAGMARPAHWPPAADEPEQAEGQVFEF